MIHLALTLVATVIIANFALAGVYLLFRYWWLWLGLVVLFVALAK